MINRIGKFKGATALLLVVLLATPLMGWNVLPRSASGGVPGENPATGNVVLQSTPDQNSPPGNVEQGRGLFMGNLHFENGGPPCMGCHNVGQNGLLGGGAMGPDLTNVFDRRSQTEILAFLSNTGRQTSPVMRAIYISHPLTWEEQVDLLAFLEGSLGQPESNKELFVLAISLAGFVVAAAALGFVYRGRLRGVRRALVKKTQVEK